MWKSHFNDKFLVLLGPIISRLFTCSIVEKKFKKAKGACSSPISMVFTMHLCRAFSRCILPCVFAMCFHHAFSPCVFAMRFRHAFLPCIFAIRFRHAILPCIFPHAFLRSLLFFAFEKNKKVSFIRAWHPQSLSIVIKLFTSVICEYVINKLACLSLEGFFKFSLIFVNKAKSLP